MAGRSRSQRRLDAIARLETEPNIWISTASPAGVPHLVPLSLEWDGSRVLVATPTAMPTVVNALATGRARAALDSAGDVVIIDADVEVVDFESVDEQIVDHYIGRVGWDPRPEPGSWSMLILTPQRVQSWNGVGETDQRTLMREGIWID